MTIQTTGEFITIIFASIGVVTVLVTFIIAFQNIGKNYCRSEKWSSSYITFKKFKECYKKAPDYCTLYPEYVFINDVYFRFKGINSICYTIFYRNFNVQKAKENSIKALKELEEMLEQEEED